MSFPEHRAELVGNVCGFISQYVTDLVDNTPSHGTPPSVRRVIDPVGVSARIRSPNIRTELDRQRGLVDSLEIQ